MRRLERLNRSLCQITKVAGIVARSQKSLRDEKVLELLYIAAAHAARQGTLQGSA